MKLRSPTWWWVLGNVAWFILVPTIFALWLAREVDAQYASGFRSSTDGDSLSIPIGASILINAVLLLAVNGIAGLVLLVRRLLRRHFRRGTHET